MNRKRVILGAIIFIILIMYAFFSLISQGITYAESGNTAGVIWVSMFFYFVLNIWK